MRILGTLIIFSLISAKTGAECGESATLIIFRSADPCFALHNSGSLDQAPGSTGAEVYCSSLCNFPGGPLIILSAARFIFGFESTRRCLTLGLETTKHSSNAVSLPFCRHACFAEKPCCLFPSYRDRLALHGFVQLDELAFGVPEGFDRAPQALEADP